MKRVRNRRTRRKKLARKSRRRQSGGGNLVINATIDPANGKLTATSSDPTVTIVPGTNTLTIENINGAIKDIKYTTPDGSPVSLTNVGASLSDTGIHMKDIATSKFIIVKSSSAYANPKSSSQIKLDHSAGAPFSEGIIISNLNVSNLSVTGTEVAKFTIKLLT